MHILFITANRKFFDEKSEEATLLKAMVAASEVLHVVVFTRKKEGFETRKISENAWVYPTNSLFSLLFGFDALRVIRRQVLWQGMFRAHIVHSDDPFLSGWLGLLLSKRYDRVWMVNIHRYFWEYDSLWHALYMRTRIMPVSWIMNYAEHVCVFSERVRIYLSDAVSPEGQKKIISFQKIYDPAAIRNAPLTVDLKQKYPASNFIILVAAPLRVGVRVGLAIEALTRLHGIPGYGKAMLVVVGHGPLKSVFELKAKSLGVGDWVRFEPEATDLISYFKSANVLLYLASGDVEDDNAISAAAAGCAIIAIPSTVASGIIRDGENGIIVPKSDDMTLMVAIRHFNEVPGLRERFKLNSSAYLNDSYVAKPESLEAELRNCWTFVEAPPEEAHLEHELSFSASDPHPGSNTVVAKIKGILRNITHTQ